ncbi:pyrimidine 5'-nucleotidase [Alcaligenes nematophilus]|uniref:Pyrimidine 5'-nucleotidase n=1 Tax=Alcaligenes nematophilus TaxID=2994643 RepID=A0ABU3MT35_9BURK|nr:pyrimidine 5'-nucleotidase [Alcaligenes nematophilus]MDT8466493.1 pyrimidine 5'-nucleotidase [Alcaligenes nematophilus]MDT8468549.1 pyrimidine 5'-nucleotidase [Alcaligenes nematophilus]MDT8504746.1 pyrimidine 5'-nucleotidase [Alcaligenes nematophilus]MDT8524970.1 pyrimidine 5'-nucleotidase [Alcaligenes nematophilus]
MRTPIRAHAWARPLSACQPDETIWLFDLDNTLHNASKGIFQAIDGRMRIGVAQTLGVDMDEADRLRLEYWKRYGATMIGLQRHHGADPATFLRHAHDFDVPSLISAEPGLAYQLRRLPGYKLLLTNAPLEYAQRVLKALNLLPVFDGLWAIEHMQLQGRYRPKPSQALMKQALAVLKSQARDIVLVEDTLRNLKSARQLGMQTIHIYNAGTPFSALYHGRSPYVDHRINRIAQLVKNWPRP